MCGICGLYSTSAASDALTAVTKMNRALLHRGPDDSGEFAEGPVALAMRRLSIIDLAGGHQPIRNEDENLVIVFNGEIYNFPELRERLLANGHSFRTRSDTEVILHLYEEEGERTPTLLHGMFAFCIYDRGAQSFFIARDRFGEKPLHYFTDTAGSFAFSSEIKSLLELDRIPRRLSRDGLGYYMRTGMTPAPLTMFEDVKVLPAGHWLKWRGGELTVQPYYEIDYRPDAGLDDPDAAVGAVRDALRRAVERQKLSDVPIGALLSGGIDSTSVAATLQESSTRPIDTFTVSFEDAAYDEAKLARRIADHLGTDHHEITVKNQTFSPDDLTRIVDHVGVPFFDSSAIPTYVLSDSVSSRVKVALSGDGGDEMFAGYGLFQSGALIRRAQRLPATLVRGASTLAEKVSRLGPLSNASSLRRVRRGLAGAALPEHMLPIALHTLFEPAELAGLLTEQSSLAVALGDLPLLTELPERAHRWSALRRLMYFRLRHVLRDRMLTKVDRMSMAASLEVRTPLLDVHVAELSMRLPDRHLIVDGVGKHVLRKALEGRVPTEVFSHPKAGFDIPLHRFQNDAYRVLASDLLSPRAAVAPLFDREELQAVVGAGLGTRADGASRSVFRSTHQLWALMQLNVWLERFRVSS